MIPLHTSRCTLVALALTVTVLFSVGCADTHRPDTFDDLLTAVPPSPSSLPTPASAPPHREVSEGGCPIEPDDPSASHALTRDTLRALLDRGFGRFLSRVRVSPVLTRGRFVGFRLECATDLPHWQAAGADVRVGDVITRINGRSIELPDVAFSIFDGLRTAPELSVEILRGEAPVTVHQAIVGSPATAAP